MTLGLAAACLLTGTYSYRIERFWYQIKEVQLKIKNLPSAFNQWKIVQFSDTHLGFHYGIEDLKPVINIIKSLNPDIIFFTGDLIQIGNNNPEVSVALLRELEGLRGGKWAVIGNHDFYTKNQVINVLESANFNFLLNNHDYIESNRQRLYIAGLDDAMYGSPNVKKAIEGLMEEDCVLLLAHEPDTADESSQYPISAQFSGHSHGGQIRIPLLGKLPVRFSCRPEITVFHLTT